MGLFGKEREGKELLGNERNRKVLGTVRKGMEWNCAGKDRDGQGKQLLGKERN